MIRESSHSIQTSFALSGWSIVARLGTVSHAYTQKPPTSALRIAAPFTKTTPTDTASQYYYSVPPKPLVYQGNNAKAMDCLF